MVKFCVSEEEWYPVFEVREALDDCWWGTVREVDEEVFNRWKAAFAAFYAVQSEILDRCAVAK